VFYFVFLVTTGFEDGPGGGVMRVETVTQVSIDEHCGNGVCDEEETPFNCLKKT